MMVRLISQYYSGASSGIRCGQPFYIDWKNIKLLKINSGVFYFSYKISRVNRLPILSRESGQPCSKISKKAVWTTGKANVTKIPFFWLHLVTKISSQFYKIKIGGLFLFVKYFNDTVMWNTFCFTSFIPLQSSKRSCNLQRKSSINSLIKFIAK